jgi:glycine dehydrogenase subunit 1
MFKYLPHTEQDIKNMLSVIGVSNIDELFKEIPDELKGHEYNVPSAMSELELVAYIDEIASKNHQLIPFVGAGVYDHYTPTVIRHLINREEFMTAYTPYQPEISQGTLQYIFEYQSIVCELTGMYVSNASMYDGPTATAEAMFLAAHATKRKKILISETVNPNTLKVVQTYAKYNGIQIDVIPEQNGHTNKKEVLSTNSNEYAGIIVQSPNKYGVIEDLSFYRSVLDETKGLFIVNSDIASLALLKTPGEYGADIACGDAQSLGIPLQYGGPYLGYFATTKKLMRKMPGRICGVTQDKEGKRAFVLTLQAREQHIRREKASSNICSNQSLMALFVTIYTAVMGKQGVVEAQQRSYDNTHYLADKLIDTKKFSLAFDMPFFKDVALKSDLLKEDIEKACINAGFVGPLALEQWSPKLKGIYLFSATEKRTLDEIERLVAVMEGI